MVLRSQQSTVREMFNLVVIWRVQAPQSTWVYIRVQIFKSKIQNWILSGCHNPLTLPIQCPIGPGFWKFNNTVLNDEQYVNRICDMYSQACNYYSHLTDRRLSRRWCLEIRSVRRSYSKSKSKRIRNREQDILWKLDFMDSIICNNFSSPDILMIRYKNMKILNWG